jgi:hypothetical protein
MVYRNIRCGASPRPLASALRGPVSIFSATFSCKDGNTCEHVPRVIPIKAWPRRSATTSGCAPARSNVFAGVCPGSRAALRASQALRQAPGKRTQRYLATRLVAHWHTCPRATLRMALRDTDCCLPALRCPRLHGGGQESALLAAWPQAHGGHRGCADPIRDSLLPTPTPRQRAVSEDVRYCPNHLVTPCTSAQNALEMTES